MFPRIKKCSPDIIRDIRAFRDSEKKSRFLLFRALGHKSGTVCTRVYCQADFKKLLQLMFDFPIPVFLLFSLFTL